MIRLKKSEALQREIRQDDPVDLAIPTTDLVREAMRTGKIDAATGFMEYGMTENRVMHDSLILRVSDVLAYLTRFGEDEVEKFQRQEYYELAKNYLPRTVNELLQIFTEYQRGHFSNTTVVDEPDRYVVRHDPCGSGGRLIRTREVATTQKAYPWSWGKSGVPYYCIHCCLAWEIIPIELRGYHLRVNLIPEKPEDACVHLLYKNPEVIPEEYFTRIGKTKTIK
jgi:hypothetical protein